MDGDMQGKLDMLRIVGRLKAFIGNDDRYGRMQADLHDLVEASEWLIASIKKMHDVELTLNEAENFLVDLDVNYVQHVTFHLTSLREDIAETLGNISALEEGSDNK